MLAAPARRATGVLTSTQADRSIRRINNPLQTLSQLVHSMIDSPHATNAQKGLLADYLRSHNFMFHKSSKSQLFIQNNTYKNCGY